MRNMLKGINARHHEALSRLFVVQVAIAAACFIVAVDGPHPASLFLILLSFFVWPLVAAWPARTGRLLRGAATNALALLFFTAYFAYQRDWLVTSRDWLVILTVLAFGMVSGIAAGGLVERRAGKRRGVDAELARAHAGHGITTFEDYMRLESPGERLSASQSMTAAPSATHHAALMRDIER